MNDLIPLLYLASMLGLVIYAIATLDKPVKRTPRLCDALRRIVL